MGSFLSCGYGFSTALSKDCVVKLVHSNGLVEEFYRSVRVGELSVDYPHHFICRSGDLRRLPSGNLRRLSEDDSMELGQIYFLLPNKIFDLPLTHADVSALFSKAGVARKASYKEVSMTVQQVSPLTTQEARDLQVEPTPTPKKPDLQFSRELIQKLIAETRLQQQSKMVSPHAVCAAKGKTVLSELETAYTRHFLSRSCRKLWRPPLETIEEGSFSTP